MGVFDAPNSIAPFVPLMVVTCTLAPLPLTIFLNQPGGIMSRTLTPLAYFGTSDLQRIAAISAFYFFMVYTFTAALSVTGAALGNPEGYSNAEPRVVKDTLTGFPHRLTALHDNLLELFPAFIICAVITLALPTYNIDRRVVESSINALVLHVFFKTCVYVPAYAAGYDSLRSIAHCCAIASLLGLLIGVVIG